MPSVRGFKANFSSSPVSVILFLCALIVFVSIHVSLYAFPLPSGHDSTNYRNSSTGKLDTTKVKQFIRKMYLFGWDNYLKHAYPLDDLKPISCSGRGNVAGHFLTLIDAADGLAIIGEVDRFIEAVQLISKIEVFDMDVDVSVFETTIRMLGGLLSTHTLAKSLVPNYDNKLLNLAEDLGKRLILAFESPSGMNFGTINLKSGRADGEISNCAACVALSPEFGYLSYLKKNSTYYELSKKSILSVFNARSRIGLVPKSVNINSGTGNGYFSGIGAEIDSFYEYLLKSYVLFNDKQFLYAFDEAYSAIEAYSYKSPIHHQVYLNSGNKGFSSFGALECFWAGMQGGIGDVNGAFEMVKFMGHLSTKYSLIPEKVNYPSLNLQISYYALRPEVMESLYHMYRVFKNPGFQEFGFEIVRRIENLAKVECGYAIISDVRQEKIYEDHMESFLLSETLKYAYLLFDEENLVHKKNMVFTTEAHPFPVIPRIPHKWKQNSRYENLVPTQKYNPLLEECNVKQYQNMRMKLFFSPASTGFNFLI